MGKGRPFTNSFIPTRPRDFKTISGFPAYGISKEGIVWNKIRNTQIKPLNESRPVPRRVQLYREDGKRKSYRTIARLVAIAFLPYEPFPEELTVAYKDGDKMNWHADNLYWVPKEYKANRGDKVRYVWERQADKYQFVGTRTEMHWKYKLDRTSMSRMIIRNQKTAKGWRCIACQLEVQK